MSSNPINHTISEQKREDALEKSWVLTHLGNGTSEGGVSVLLVHVDGVSS